MALNNHFFQTTYDYFLYSGKVNIKPETYHKKRPDEKYRYEKLGKKFPYIEELENFIVSNMLSAKKRIWIGNLTSGIADDVYLQWQGKTQSLQYNFSNDIKFLLNSCNSLNNIFKSEDNNHPEIIKSLMRENITLESFVILEICLEFIKKLDKKLGDDRNWMMIKNKTIKYKPFIERLNIDVKSYENLILKEITELGIKS